jgi:hypothetical protein
MRTIADMMRAAISVSCTCGLRFSEFDISPCLALVGVWAQRRIALDEISPVLCGKCHVAPERGFERDGEVWAACPICGQEERMEDIARQAAENRFDKMIRGTFSGIQSSSLTVKSPPERQYRWIIAS